MRPSIDSCIVQSSAVHRPSGVVAEVSATQRRSLSLNLTSDIVRPRFVSAACQVRSFDKSATPTFTFLRDSLRGARCRQYFKTRGRTHYQYDRSIINTLKMLYFSLLQAASNYDRASIIRRRFRQLGVIESERRIDR